MEVVLVRGFFYPKQHGLRLVHRVDKAAEYFLEPVAGVVAVMEAKLVRFAFLVIQVVHFPAELVVSVIDALVAVAAGFEGLQVLHHGFHVAGEVVIVVAGIVVGGLSGF